MSGTSMRGEWASRGRSTHGDIRFGDSSPHGTSPEHLPSMNESQVANFVLDLPSVSLLSPSVRSRQPAATFLLEVGTSLTKPAHQRLAHILGPCLVPERCGEGKTKHCPFPGLAQSPKGSGAEREASSSPGHEFSCSARIEKCYGLDEAGRELPTPLVPNSRRVGLEFPSVVGWPLSQSVTLSSFGSLLHVRLFRTLLHHPRQCP